MRFAYADPPYIGKAKKHYGREEVDHVQLIHELCTYDGWALSANSTTLQYLLPVCPQGVRVAAWVKPFCAWKINVNPAYAWEPVIWTAPKRRDRGYGKPKQTIRDWVSASMTTKKGTHGAKPEQFCYWLFDILDLQPGDIFDDLFPGSGAVTQAYQQWQSRLDFEGLAVNL